MTSKTYQEVQKELYELRRIQKVQELQRQVKALRKQVHPSRFRRFLHYSFKVVEYTATGLYYCGLGVVAVWTFIFSEPKIEEVQ